MFSQTLEHLERICHFEQWELLSFLRLVAISFTSYPENNDWWKKQMFSEWICSLSLKQINNEFPILKTFLDLEQRAACFCCECSSKVVFHIQYLYNPPSFSLLLQVGPCVCHTQQTESIALLGMLSLCPSVAIILCCFLVSFQQNCQGARKSGSSQCGLRRQFLVLETCNGTVHLNFDQPLLSNNIVYERVISCLIPEILDFNGSPNIFWPNRPIFNKY